MVGFKAASMAVLLGSAALTSAAAVPKVCDGLTAYPVDTLFNAAADEQENDHTEPHQRRLWRGRLGARGPWRDESVKRAAEQQDHYLINIDLSGDGPHQNGIGDLIDINSREVHSRGLLETPFDPKTGDEKKKAMEKWHFGSNGRKSAQGKGKGKGKREWDEFESIASSAGVQPDDIDAAKKAASDNMTPEQQEAVMNAVKKAVWDSRHHGERRSMPGPAFLFRARDVEEEEKEEKEGDREAVKSLLSLDAKVKVLGDTPEGETGVMSTDSETQYGVPLVVAGAKRDAGDEMEGAPGYIDITSPVFDSEAQRIASLVLSTANDASTNSSFVLNASSNIRTQVYLVPLKVEGKAQPGSAAPASGSDGKGDLIKVNLKVPVFVADTATVEPYCATFDPAPDAPSPMTVEPCDDVSDDMPQTESTTPADGSASVQSAGEKSQVFLFDPETGVVKPDWSGSAASAKSAPDAGPSISSVASASSTTSASATSSVSATKSGDFAAKAAAETSSLSSLPSSVPASVAPSAPTGSKPSSTPVEAYPSETSSIPELPRLSAVPSISNAPQAMAALSSYVHTASAPSAILPHASAASSAVAPVLSSVPVPVQPSVSASASHPVSSIAGSAPTASAPISAPVASKPASLDAAAASSAPVPSTPASSVAPAASSAAAIPANQGNNVTLIFSPSQASVLSKEDKDVTSSALNISPDTVNQEDAETMSVPTEADSDVDTEEATIENDEESTESAPTYDDGMWHPDTQGEQDSSLNTPEGSGLVARAHAEDDCEDVESVGSKTVGIKSTTKPKAKLPDGQDDQGESKKISLGKGGVVVDDARKLKEESGEKEKAAKAEKVKGSAASPSFASAMHSKLGARFLRRQQTVLQTKDFDATAPYE